MSMLLILLIPWQVLSTYFPEIFRNLYYFKEFVACFSKHPLHKHKYYLFVTSFSVSKKSMTLISCNFHYYIKHFHVYIDHFTSVFSYWIIKKMSRITLERGPSNVGCFCYVDKEDEKTNVYRELF